jgi:hypothetical protein
LIGLTLFNVFDLVNYALLGVIFLALYVALRRADRRLVAIAVVLGLGGVIVAFASSRAFPMLSLSRQYAAASEGERAVLLGEGERLLAVDNPGALYPGAGPTMALFLVTVAAVIVAIVMLRSPVFSRGTATVGLVGESVQLLYFVALALAPLPVLLAISSSLAAPFRLVWYLLIGRRLLQLARATKRDGETALT